MLYERGTFNPADDPFPGSSLDKLEVPRAEAGKWGRMMAFIGTALIPSQMRVQDLLAYARIPYNPGDKTEQKYRNRIRSPATAVRAYCVMCAGGPKASWECEKVECPLWPFHRGRSSLRPGGANK